jgi:hypothetical protein
MFVEFLFFLSSYEFTAGNRDMNSTVLMQIWTYMNLYHFFYDHRQLMEGQTKSFLGILIYFDLFLCSI